jgi:hypothetical protein
MKTQDLPFLASKVIIKSAFFAGPSAIAARRDHAASNELIGVLDK